MQTDRLSGRGVFAPPTHRKRQSVPVNRFEDEDHSAGNHVNRIRVGTNYQARVPRYCTYDSVDRGDALNSTPNSPSANSRESRRDEHTGADKPARTRQEKKARSGHDT